MRDKLMPLNQVREIIGADEPLGEVLFRVGEMVRFDVSATWQFGVKAKQLADPVDVWITVGRGKGKQELRLTKEALFQITTYAGMPATYAEKLPGQLLGPSLNYWYREGLVEKSGSRTRSFKILTSRGDAVGITRQSTDGFSNLQLLDHVLTGIENKYGDVEVLADPRVGHSLFQTWLRLIIPGVGRTIDDTAVDDDQWSVGILLKNSLVGRGRTSVDGYLFRWVCGNGAIDVRNPAGGVWVRKQHQPNDGVWEWTTDTVGRLLDHVDTSLDAVQASAYVPVEGNVADVLKDIFQYYKVPIRDRPKIIENLSQAPKLTMYEVMQAITRVANEPGTEHTFIESLQRLGGELPYAATSVCDACRRLSHIH